MGLHCFVFLSITFVYISVGVSSAWALEYLSCVEKDAGRTTQESQLDFRRGQEIVPFSKNFQIGPWVHSSFCR